MNSKRSMWKVLLGVVGVGLLVTNCTIKTDDSCTPGKKKNCEACDNGVTGTQTCLDDGTYDACYCPGSNTGGGSSVAGGTSAGASSVAGGSSGGASNGGGAGEGGAGEAGATTSGDAGAGGEGPGAGMTDCYGCLNQFCQLEWDACVLEDETTPDTPGNYCLSSKLDGTGQIEAVLACIEAERSKGLVKRDAVRACGSSLGQSSDPAFFQWPPTNMTPPTVGVLNCMADAPDEVMKPGRWADSSNIPASGSPTPWLDMTCAKLACTSAQ